MRRVDVLAIGVAVFLVGGLLYIVLRGAGLDASEAGTWSQAIFLVILLGWVSTYLFRVVGGNMTYNRQRDEYETAFLQKRLDEMTPAELEALQAELEQEKQGDTSVTKD